MSSRPVTRSITHSGGADPALRGVGGDDHRTPDGLDQAAFGAAGDAARPALTFTDEPEPVATPDSRNPLERVADFFSGRPRDTPAAPSAVVDAPSGVVDPHDPSSNAGVESVARNDEPEADDAEMPSNETYQYHG